MGCELPAGGEEAAGYELQDGGVGGVGCEIAERSEESEAFCGKGGRGR